MGGKNVHPMEFSGFGIPRCPADSASPLTCRRTACVGSPYLQHSERDSQMILQSLSLSTPMVSLPPSLSISGGGGGARQQRPSWS